MEWVKRKNRKEFFLCVNCLYTGVYMLILWVSKKRSFNGHKDNRYFLNLQDV